MFRTSVCSNQTLTVVYSRSGPLSWCQSASWFHVQYPPFRCYCHRLLLVDHRLDCSVDCCCCCLATCCHCCVCWYCCRGDDDGSDDASAVAHASAYTAWPCGPVVDRRNTQEFDYFINIKLDTKIPSCLTPAHMLDLWVLFWCFFDFLGNPLKSGQSCHMCDSSDRWAPPRHRSELHWWNMHLPFFSCPAASCVRKRRVR